MSAPLLDVDKLRTSFAVGGRQVQAVRDVSFTLGEREVLGLIGESGSGKTVTGLSLLRLLPEHATVSAAAIRFRGRDLTEMADDELRAVRGAGDRPADGDRRAGERWLEGGGRGPPRRRRHPRP